MRFPLPVRTALPPLSEYAKLEHNGAQRVSGYVEASRGCLHLCTHCPIPPVYGGRFFIIPSEVVLEDVRRQVDAGATHITFGDPDFLNGPGHALKVVRALHTEFPQLTFDFTAKVEHLLAQPQVVREDMDTTELKGQLDDNATYTYWTFNGKVPGPFVRIRVGDTVEVHLKNHDDSIMMHNVDFHAVTGPGGGTAQKPVGLVYLGVARKDGAARVERRILPGDRAAVRDAALALALELLRDEAQPH